MEVEFKTIGKNIKAFRLLNGWTQGKLAEKTGISKNAIYNYENNKRIPNLDMINKIAKAFGVSSNEIINLDKLGIDDIYKLKTLRSKLIPLTDRMKIFIETSISFYGEEIEHYKDIDAEKTIFYLSLRAYYYILLDNYDYAIDDYKKALEIDPNFKSICFDSKSLYKFLNSKSHDKTLETDIDITKIYDTMHNKFKTFSHPEKDTDNIKETVKTISNIQNNLMFLDMEELNIVKRIVSAFVNEKNFESSKE